MSFMFHPYPYVDPDAVNPIHAPESVKNGLVKGPQSVAKEIARQIKAEASHAISMRYLGPEVTLNPTDRLLLGSRTFNLVSAVNVEERDRRYELVVQEIETTGTV